MQRVLVISAASLLLSSPAAWARPQPQSGPFVSLAAGASHTLALRSDGSVIAHGENFYGACNVPPPPVGESYVEVAAGGIASGVNYWGYHGHGFSAARLGNGSVVAWGDNSLGQCDVPALPPGLTYVQLDAGPLHALGRRSNGTVVDWGATCPCWGVPAAPLGLTYVDVAAGGVLLDDPNGCCWGPTAAYLDLSAALLSDGSIVVWGIGSFSVGPAPALPPGLTYVGVSAGGLHLVARRSDGLAVAWGDNAFGQCNVPALPPGLKYVEIEAGGAHTLARRSDGSVVAWGDNSYGQCNVPALPPGLGYVEVVAGGTLFIVDNSSTPGLPNSYYTEGHSVARRSDGSVVAWGGNQAGQCDLPQNAGAQRYCSSAVNSTGAAATIHALGSASLAANDLVLSAVGVPDGAFVFLRGTTQALMPLGNGTLCVGGGVQRMNVPGLASNGLAQLTVDLAGTGITSTGARTFQCWFRDAQGGGAGFNTTDAIAIAFVP